MKYLLALLASLPFMVEASHSCFGKVSKIQIIPNASVQVDIEGIGNGNRLCSLKYKLGEYEPEACKAVLSMLITAQAANKDINLYFSNDENTSCNKGNSNNFTGPEFGLSSVILQN